MMDQEPDHVAFEKRIVPADADHDYGFWGSYTYDDEHGRVHTIERLFKIYADPDRRENDDPVAVVTDTHLVAEAPQEESRAGDASQVDRTTRELLVDADSDREGSAIHEWCKQWHESHLEPPE